MSARSTGRSRSSRKSKSPRCQLPIQNTVLLVLATSEAETMEQVHSLGLVVKQRTAQRMSEERVDELTGCYSASREAGAAAAAQRTAATVAHASARSSSSKSSKQSARTAASGAKEIIEFAAPPPCNMNVLSGVDSVALLLCGAGALSVVREAFPAASLLGDNGGGDGDEKRGDDGDDEERADGNGSEVSSMALDGAATLWSYCCLYPEEVARLTEFFFAPPELDLDEGASRLAPPKKSSMVSIEVLMRFLFPDDQVHPWSTGRLLVFGEYGPLDENSNLRSGIRGNHVVRKHELDQMIKQVENDDLVQTYVGDGLWSLTTTQKNEIISQADSHLKRRKNLSKREVLEMFENLALDENGCASFHEMQRIILEYRRFRIKRWKRMYPDLTSGTAPGGKASREARALAKTRSAALTTAMNKALRKQKKINDNETFTNNSRLLNRHSFKICTMEDKNHPSLVQNVHLMRSDIAPVGTETWSSTACVARQNRGTYVKAFGHGNKKK